MTSSRLRRAESRIAITSPLLHLFYGELGIDLDVVAEISRSRKVDVEKSVARWRITKFHGFLRDFDPPELADVAVVLGDSRAEMHLRSIDGYGRASWRIGVPRDGLVLRARAGEIDWSRVGALASMLAACERHFRVRSAA